MPADARPLALVVTLALALLAGGCGGGDGVPVKRRTLSVRLDEFLISPQDSKVRPGRLRLVAHNVGRLTHNAKIVRRDEEDLEAPVEELGGTRTAQPGETVAYTFEDLAPGEYRVVCTISNHDDLGQYGELIVEEREGG